MKIERIKNKYHSLSDVAEHLTNFRPSVIDAMDSLLGYGFIRPNRQTGRGRYTRLISLGGEIDTACERCGIKLVKFNDAPRGGRLGEIWFLSGSWIAVEENGQIVFHAVDEVYNTRGIFVDHLPKVAQKYIMDQAFGEV